MATIVESILARSYAFVVVSLRYLIVGGWAAAAVLAIMFLPPLSATSSGGLSNLIPPGSAAARAEADAAHLFGFPIDAAVAIVQRDPHGMPAATRDRAIRQAVAVDRRLSGQPEGQLAAAAAALARPASRRPPGSCPARSAQGRGAVHHGHHVPVLQAGHLVRRADGGRERLRALVPQPPG